MKWYQIVMIILWSMGFALNLFKHGQPREGNYNVITFLIAVAIEITILFYAGFFN